MSQKNRLGKRTAIERMHEERRRQEARGRRLRAVGVFGSVVAVIAVAGVAGVLLAGRGGDGATQSTAAPAGASGDGRVVISVGEPDAPSALDVYEDFRCPACGQFEAQYHKTIGDLVEQGRLRVDYHLASFIDGNVGGTGSKYAANAAACSQDHGAFAEYHDVLFANQPPETEDAFGQKNRLIELAQKVPALKANKDFDTCVDEGAYDGWVSRSQAAFDESGFTSTPTVLLNGKDIFADRAKPLTPRALAAKVRQAAGREPGVKSSAEPSASVVPGTQEPSAEGASPSTGASTGTVGSTGPAGSTGSTGPGESTGPTGAGNATATAGASAGVGTSSGKSSGTVTAP